jgi:hypothetical protein
VRHLHCCCGTAAAASTHCSTPPHWHALLPSPLPLAVPPALLRCSAGAGMCQFHMPSAPLPQLAVPSALLISGSASGWRWYITAPGAVTVLAHLLSAPRRLHTPPLPQALGPNAVQPLCPVTICAGAICTLCACHAATWAAHGRYCVSARPPPYPPPLSLPLALAVHTINCHCHQRRSCWRSQWHRCPRAAPSKCTMGAAYQCRPCCTAQLRRCAVTSGQWRRRRCALPPSMPAPVLPSPTWHDTLLAPSLPRAPLLPPRTVPPVLCIVAAATRYAAQSSCKCCHCCAPPQPLPVQCHHFALCFKFKLVLPTASIVAGNKTSRAHWQSSAAAVRAAIYTQADGT